MATGDTRSAAISTALAESLLIPQQVPLVSRAECGFYRKGGNFKKNDQSMQAASTSSCQDQRSNAQPTRNCYSQPYDLMPQFPHLRAGLDSGTEKAFPGRRTDPSLQCRLQALRRASHGKPAGTHGAGSSVSEPHEARGGTRVRWQKVCACSKCKQQGLGTANPSRGLQILVPKISFCCSPTCFG